MALAGLLPACRAAGELDERGQKKLEAAVARAVVAAQEVVTVMQVMIRWQFQLYTYIHMIWVLEIAESHPSKKAPSFQCEKGPMILNFPLL